MNLRLARKNREVEPDSWDKLYENTIIRKIRKKYSINQEFAILRQKDTKPYEFEEYNEFVEECKQEAKNEINNGF